MRAVSSLFFIILGKVHSKFVFPSFRWNLRGVCKHIGCWWQVSCSIFWEFATPNSNAVIWKTKNFFSIFFPFLESPSNFKHFEKKMMVIANMFPNFQIVKNFVTPLHKKRGFGTRLDSRHVKLSQILAKSPWEHFYHFSSSFWGKFIRKMSSLVLGEI